MNFSRIGDVIQRVGIKDDQIGPLSFGNLAPVGQFQQRRGLLGCYADCLNGRESCIDQMFQLAMFGEARYTFWKCTCIRTKAEFYTASLYQF